MRSAKKWSAARRSPEVVDERDLGLVTAVRHCELLEHIRGLVEHLLNRDILLLSVLDRDGALQNPDMLRVLVGYALNVLVLPERALRYALNNTAR